MNFMVIYYILAAIVMGVVILVLAVFLLSLVDRYRYPQLSRKERERIQQELKDRLLNPDFESVEKHFEHSIPAALRSLYEDRDAILQMEFSTAKDAGVNERGRFYISSFEPMDMKNVNNSYIACEKYFCFANDGCGNSYMVDPGLSDPPVMFHNFEELKIEAVGSSLSEFLSWPKFNEFA